MDKREAAERLVKFHDDYDYTYWDGNKSPFCPHKDGVDVARAYLAEHPSDDWEEITGDWLRSVGFTFGHEWPNGVAYCELEADYSTITVSEPHGVISDWSESEWIVGGERIPHGLMPDNRGEVRYILRALGL